MPQWASSVVPEGSLLRQLSNQEQEKEHRRHSVNFQGASSSSMSARKPQTSNNNQLLSFAQAMEGAMNLDRANGSSHHNNNRQWNSTATNPVHQNNNNKQNASFKNNIQYSQDPVTMNIKTRSLAANGTFGAKRHIIPMHVRSVVSTLRRNVDEMKRFANEIPILTTAEMPSATKRLAALLYAQTIAVDDLCRFTEDELKFASGKFYDLVSQMMELQMGKEDAEILETILKANKKNTEATVAVSQKVEVEKKSFGTQTGEEEEQPQEEEESQQKEEETPQRERNNDNTDKTDDTDDVPYFAQGGGLETNKNNNKGNASPLLPQTKAIRDLLLQTSPSTASYNNAHELSLMSTRMGENDPFASFSVAAGRSSSPSSSSSPHRTFSSIGRSVRESLKELNSFRCLYSMLAGVANITGASEGRLFLYPSQDLLAVSKQFANRGNQEDQYKKKKRNNHQNDDDDDEDEDDLVDLDDEEINRRRAAARKQKQRTNANLGMETLDPEKLYLIAQVQASSFAPVRTATASRDIVRIAESVADTRCAANLTPGVARVRASFESLIAVPLFVTKQPESAVLGVLVLTNKRMMTNSSSKRNNTENNKNNNNATSETENEESVVVSKLSDTNTNNNINNQQTTTTTSSSSAQHSHFDNSASSSSWITRGFFHDDEHKAVIAAEMMSWFVEKVPTGIVMRGAVRLTPSGFEEEWSSWTSTSNGPAGSSSVPDSSRNHHQNFASTAANGLPVLDPQMSLLQVPRRRFVFRTEDPREVAATGKLKLQNEKGFSQATTSSSGGGDLHINSRKSQAATFAKMKKTRSLIAPESGEYLINVAQSHRIMERKTEELENEVAALRQEMADVKKELELEQGLRKQAEDAAHSMQVACDRIVRKSIFSNNPANHSHASPSSASPNHHHHNHQQNKYIPRPPSSSSSSQQQQQTNNSLLFETDLASYTSASRPYSKTNVGARPSSSSSSCVNNNNNNKTLATFSRPQSSQSQLSNGSTNDQHTNNGSDAGGEVVGGHHHHQQHQQQQQPGIELVGGTTHNDDGSIMTLTQLLAASNVPFTGRSNQAIPSFHSKDEDQEKREKLSAKRTSSGQKLSKVQKRVMSEEKRMYY